jgi:hypothetical protein
MSTGRPFREGRFEVTSSGVRQPRAGVARVVRSFALGSSPERRRAGHDTRCRDAVATGSSFQVARERRRGALGRFTAEPPQRWSRRCAVDSRRTMRRPHKTGFSRLRPPGLWRMSNDRRFTLASSFDCIERAGLVRSSWLPARKRPVPARTKSVLVSRLGFKGRGDDWQGRASPNAIVVLALFHDFAKGSAVRRCPALHCNADS